MLKSFLLQIWHDLRSEKDKEYYGTSLFSRTVEHIPLFCAAFRPYCDAVEWETLERSIDDIRKSLKARVSRLESAAGQTYITICPGMSAFNWTVHRRYRHLRQPNGLHTSPTTLLHLTDTKNRMATFCLFSITRKAPMVQHIVNDLQSCALAYCYIRILKARYLLFGRTKTLWNGFST